MGNVRTNARSELGTVPLHPEEGAPAAGPGGSLNAHRKGSPPAAPPHRQVAPDGVRRGHDVVGKGEAGALAKRPSAQGPDELANLVWRALRAEGGT